VGVLQGENERQMLVAGNRGVGVGVGVGGWGVGGGGWGVGGGGSVMRECMVG
jgi:hypothetical protein